MMQLNLKDIDKAKIVFNHMLKVGDIEDIIRGMRELDPQYTSWANTQGIAQWVEDLKESFSTEVTLYRPWNRWSSAYATTYTGNYKKIKLNQYKISRSVASLAGSIAHEWGHCFEYFVREGDSKIEFNHGGNSPVGKEDTFQYQLGKMVKEYIKGQGDEFLRNLGLE